MKIKNFIILILLIFTAQPLWSQTDSVRQTELAERLHSLAKNAPQELAYIQTSKDIYETGEDLWFKVYILDAQYLTPSFLSKTLYLQLRNEATKKTIWNEKYEIQDGFANGQLYIGNALSDGDYLLEAYTASSFFDDSIEFRAVRKIKIRTDIASPDSLLISKEKNTSETPVNIFRKDPIQFTTFPEGGNLVSGILSRLAFKAVNTNGEPLDVKGTLFEDSSPILQFKSIHAGMGSFYFTPGINKKYSIRLSEPATDSLFLLPEILSTGITFQLTGRDKESLSFQASQSPGLPEENIYLRVQCRGVVYGMASGNLKSDISIKMPLSDLPQGIAEVTLFNSKLVPVAERLVYVNKDQKLNISTELSKEIYQTREKATLKIKVKDEDDQPVETNLCVSVFDNLYRNQGDSVNILNHYYLSTQLKGRIYNPSYYFNGNDIVRSEALDLLLLTQGWRTYEWNESNLEKYKNGSNKLITDGIKGKLTVTSDKRRTKPERVFVMSYCPNKDNKKLMIEPDSSRTFTVPSEELLKGEGDYVYLKPISVHKYPPPIKMEDPFESIDRVMKTREISYPVQSLSIAAYEDHDVTVRQGVNVIREVTIKGNKLKVIRGKYMGQLDSIAKFDMNTDWVCEYNVLNCPNHPPDAYSTKPVSGKFYYQFVAFGTPNAHLVYTMYTIPKYSEEELLKLHFLWRVKGYYANRKFYQPNYDVESDLGGIPDFRNTLVWEPSVITDKNGEATLTFFCSDINTDFVGRIEGVSGTGLLGIGSFKFTVRKLKINP
jgi:hypothetical protein